MSPTEGAGAAPTWRLALLPWGLALALVLAAAASRDLVERVYARGLYPRIAAALARLNGWTSASLAELVLLAVGLALAWRGARVLAALGRAAAAARARRAVERLLALARCAALLGGGLYLAFLCLWGLNYQRPALAVLLGYEERVPAADELRALCGELVRASARSRAGVGEDERGCARLSGDLENALLRVRVGLLRAPELAGRAPAPGRPKAVRAPAVLAALGLSGVYFPFTGEANVNSLLPASEVPFTASHELAHQLGFAREDEANFVAWLACRAHPDPDFRYSGDQAALRYALGALAAVDRAACDALVREVAEPVRRDWEAAREFWRGWRSPLVTVAASVNDAYLGAQGERDGVASYGRMVDLLLAERRARR